MTTLVRTLANPVTYRRLGYLLLEVPLGTIWFTALVTLWSLGFGLVLTPFVIPVVLLLAAATRGFTAVEVGLARSLLDVDARMPSMSAASGNWRARMRAQFGPGFWRAQGYLWSRWFLAFPAGTLLLGLIGWSLSLIVGPLWMPLVPRSANIDGLHIHTFVQALTLVPAGLVLLPLSIALAYPLGAAFIPLARRLLREEDGHWTVSGSSGSVLPGSARAGLALAGPTRRGLVVHAGVQAAIITIVLVVWAATTLASTSLGYFWPIWVIMPFATTLGMHAWLYRVGHDPAVARRFRGRASLAGSTGVATIFWLFTVGIWAVSSHGYFWPVWPLLGLVIAVGAHAAAVLLAKPQELMQRIESLTASRAGAVDIQDSELRRIERDLHDGAQARLVALGMSLGMAEQKLTDDPERAGELLAEARAGAEAALRELRDLARGIHPPVLTDRGLEAAITALASSTHMHVALSVDVPKRPTSTVESAAYFVVAEALANAAKHSGSEWLDIRIATVGRHLELEVTDDGAGGADPGGSGLVGLRHRVEALDGTLELTSPAGGPTTVYAELPCA
ncbi:MAG TPA: sensor domain-containing protein [Solirubrobacteraceae bacterium]|jgi:signal transduction histidine kinase|nr:sensor domain-containing protein [Solirubrobacteraceae bacterium]